jgi:hypothetical protein
MLVPQLPQRAPQRLDFIHVTGLVGLCDFEQFNNLLHLTQNGTKLFDDVFYFPDCLANRRLLSRAPALLLAVDSELRLRGARHGSRWLGGLFHFTTGWPKAAPAPPSTPTTATSAHQRRT